MYLSDDMHVCMYENVCGSACEVMNLYVFLSVRYMCCAWVGMPVV